MKLWEKMKTPKFLQTSGSPTRTRKRVPISDIRHRKSYIVHRTSDIGHRTSDIGHRTADIGHQTSEIGHRTLDIRHQHQISDIGPQKSDVGHQTSEIRHQTSDIGHQTSDIGHRCVVRYLMSDLRCLLFDVWRLTNGHWTYEICIHPISFFKKKKLGLLACYSFEFNFGGGISLGFVGTFMGFYFPLLIVIHVSLARESPLGE